ncbi:hypothetical protein WJ976_11020 [Achromobacter denitrificans]
MVTWLYSALMRAGVARAENRSTTEPSARRKVTPLAQGDALVEAEQQAGIDVDALAVVGRRAVRQRRARRGGAQIGQVEAHAQETLLGLGQVLGRGTRAGEYGIAVVHQQLHGRPRRDRAGHFDDGLQAAAAGGAHGFDVVGDFTRRVGGDAAPGIQREVARGLAAGGARRAGQDQVLPVGAAGHGADAAPAQVEFDGRAEAGLAGLARHQFQRVEHRDDERAVADVAVHLRSAETQPQRFAVGSRGGAFDGEAVYAFRRQARGGRAREAEIVDALSVQVAAIPGNQLLFQLREYAHIGESGVAAGAADFDGEHMAALGDRVAAILAIAVRSEEERQIADHGAGFDVQFLEQRRAFDGEVPLQDRRAALARVDAQHVRFVVGDDHPVGIQRDGGRRVGRAMQGAGVGQERPFGDRRIGDRRGRDRRRRNRRNAGFRRPGTVVVVVVIAAAGGQQTGGKGGGQDGAGKAAAGARGAERLGHCSYGS